MVFEIIEGIMKDQERRHKAGMYRDIVNESTSRID